MMKKLYQKDETLFSILCIVAYVVCFGTIRGNFGDDSPYALLAMLAFSAAALVFLGKNKLWEKYGLTFWPKAKDYLFFLPFLVMATINLWCGIEPHFSGVRLGCAICTMALVGFVEEIIFRGFLFKAMEKENAGRAIIVSAVTFGIGHIVNLLTGHTTVDTFLQIAYAIAIGFSFVLLFCKSGSLLPCIVTHSLIDMTSLFSNTTLPEETQQLVNIGFSMVLILVAGGYALYLRKKH